VIGAPNDSDLVTSTHASFDDDSQISAGSHGIGEAARENRIVHSNSKPPTRHPRSRNLKNGGPDLPTLADERIVYLNAFGREVFAKLAEFNRAAKLLFPPARVFNGICIDRFVDPAMRLPIRLMVSVEVYTSNGDSTCGWGFPNSTLGRPAVVFELVQNRG
jgi:hypothetical protein